MDNNQTTRKNAGNNGLAGFLRGGFKAGLGVAENMHKFAVELPLNMVPGFVATEEQTGALKAKHSELLRGLYGTIDNVGCKVMDMTADGAEALATKVRDVLDEDAEQASVVKTTPKAATDTSEAAA